MITLLFMIGGLGVFNFQILKEELTQRLIRLKDIYGLVDHEVWVAFGHQSRIYVETKAQY